MRHRKPNRLKHYDYSNAGWYYVTICTKDHTNRFGKIINEKMILNDNGKIVNEFWHKIEILHQNIELDYYVNMPNHIHGIIIITNPDKNVGDPNFASPTLDRTKMELCILIQQFKRAVTLKIKSIDDKSNFKWQLSFYDRIIRNERELYNIRKYIRRNLLKWDLEKCAANLEM